MKFKLGNIVHDVDDPRNYGELVSITDKGYRFRVNGVVRYCQKHRLRLGAWSERRSNHSAAIRQAAARFGLTPRQYLQASE